MSIEQVMSRFAKRSKEISNRDRELTTNMAFIHNAMLLSCADHALAKRGKALVEGNRELFAEFIFESKEAQHVPG